MKLLIKFYLIVNFLLLSVVSLAQEKEIESGEVYQNPALGTKPRILVIPYPQHLFFASGEHYICKRSGINRVQLNEKFRRSLDATLTSGISLYFYTKNFMVRNSQSGYNPQTDIIHKIFQYQDVRQLVIAHYKAYPSKTLTRIFKSDAKTYGSNCVNKGGNRPRTMYKDFRKPILKNDTLLEQLLLNNECNYMLMMTQFELVTRYDNCANMENSVYQRDLYLHFSLLDLKGKVVTEGVVGTTYQDDSNDADYIIENYLQYLTDVVIDQVRFRLH